METPRSASSRAVIFDYPRPDTAWPTHRPPLPSLAAGAPGPGTGPQPWAQGGNSTIMPYHKPADSPRAPLHQLDSPPAKLAACVELLWDDERLEALANAPHAAAVSSFGPRPQAEAEAEEGAPDPGGVLQPVVGEAPRSTLMATRDAAPPCLSPPRPTGADAGALCCSPGPPEGALLV